MYSMCTRHRRRTGRDRCGRRDADGARDARRTDRAPRRRGTHYAGPTPVRRGRAVALAPSAASGPALPLAPPCGCARDRMAPTRSPACVRHVVSGVKRGGVPSSIVPVHTGFIGSVGDVKKLFYPSRVPVPKCQMQKRDEKRKCARAGSGCAMAWHVPWRAAVHTIDALCKQHAHIAPTVVPAD